jgi:hypothetical protein
MLGKLTDEYSCANSRFFRSTLYANEEISRQLRENFILHWESVRPVPVITIDFGDGRVLKRTVTGNSAHYMLTPDGQPVDLLPGLYGPAAFQEWLSEAGDLSRACGELPIEERAAWLAEYHAQRLAAVEEAYQADLAQLGYVSAYDDLDPQIDSADSTVGGEGPDALAAGELARGKGEIEMPLLAEVLPLRLGELTANAEALSDDTWQAIAALHSGEAEIDDASRRLITAENPTAWQAARIAFFKSKVEDPILAMLENLENSIAIDTVRNEYLLHAQVHRWFVEGSTPAELATFTERVYAELFLTPSSDPWLGLAPADTYTALQDGGLSVESADVARAQDAEGEVSLSQ